MSAEHQSKIPGPHYESTTKLLDQAIQEIELILTHHENNKYEPHHEHYSTQYTRVHIAKSELPKVNQYSQQLERKLLLGAIVIKLREAHLIYLNQSILEHTHRTL